MKKGMTRFAILIFVILIFIAVSIRIVQEKKQIVGDITLNEQVIDMYLGNSPLQLDSSVSEINLTISEKTELLNELNVADYSNAFIFYNVTTRAGTSFSITKDVNSELLGELLDMFFNDHVQYSTVEIGLQDKAYAAYITFSGAKELDPITIFIFGNSIIRFGGEFFQGSEHISSKPLDHAYQEYIASNEWK